METEKSRKWYLQRDGSERKQLPRVSKFTIIDTQYANKAPQMIVDFYGVQNKEKRWKIFMMEKKVSAWTRIAFLNM